LGTAAALVTDFSLAFGALSGLGAALLVGAAGKLPGLVCANAKPGLSHRASQTGPRATKDRIHEA